MDNWLVYALAAMILIAGGNFAFKVLAKDFNFARVVQENTPVIALIALACAAVLYFFVFPRASGAMLAWLVAALVCFVIGNFLVIAALEKGKVALVSAVLGLSTVVLALASMKFLGDSFSPKEAVALLLAVCSVLLLAL